MGLDITVIGKPLPGHDAEFQDLLITLAADAGLMPDPRLGPKRGFLRKLFGRIARQMSEKEREAMTDRMHAIEAAAHTVLGAPVVGQDAARRSAGLWPSPAIHRHARRNRPRADSPVGPAGWGFRGSDRSAAAVAHP